MGLPGKRLSSSRGRRRRAHDALTPRTLGRCPSCAAPVRPHRACAACGTYRGRTVASLKARVVKKASKGAKKGKRPAA